MRRNLEGLFPVVVEEILCISCEQGRVAIGSPPPMDMSQRPAQ